MATTNSIVYDAAKKIWSNANYPHWDFINQSIGAVFLKTMRSVDENKVLEFFYDLELEKTAGEIYREAVTVAKNLQRFGIKEGEVVVLYSMNNPQTTTLSFGCFLIGAVVNFFEPKLAEPFIDGTLELLQPALILYEEQWWSDLSASLKRNPLPTLKAVLTIDGTATPHVQTELLLPISRAEIDEFSAVTISAPQQEIACYVLTSGTTGKPKAVQQTHAFLLHGCATFWGHAKHALNSDSVVFSFSPLRWISQIEMMFQSVLYGLKRVCVAELPAGAYGREVIRKGQITHYFSPPTIFTDILRCTAESDRAALSSLRFVELGGEAISQALLDLSKKMTTDCEVFSCYGMTELCSVIANHERVNGGPLVPGQQLQILDEQMQPLGPNVYGQLYIRGPVPFKGYLKVDNSVDFFADGFFLSGDYGLVDEQHNLHVECRYKDLVRTKEVILIPTKIEALVNTLPDVADSRLVGCKLTANEVHEIGCLFIEPQSTNTLSMEELHKQVLTVLTDKITPVELCAIRAVHLIDKLPLTTCGKVDRVPLRQRAAQLISSS